MIPEWYRIKEMVLRRKIILGTQHLFKLRNILTILINIMIFQRIFLKEKAWELYSIVNRTTLKINILLKILLYCLKQ